MKSTCTETYGNPGVGSAPGGDASGEGAAATDTAAAALYRRFGFRDAGQAEPLRPGLVLQGMRREL